MSSLSWKNDDTGNCGIKDASFCEPQGKPAIYKLAGSLPIVPFSVSPFTRMICPIRLICLSRLLLAHVAVAVAEPFYNRIFRRWACGKIREAPRTLDIPVIMLIDCIFQDKAQSPYYLIEAVMGKYIEKKQNKLFA